MNPAVVARAILTRLKADTTLYSGGAWTSALAGGSSFNKASAQTLTFPYLVYSVEFNSANTFTGLMGEVQITFTVLDDDASGTSRLEVVLDRLIGDSMLSSGTRTVPTYGFHNHKLALPAIGSTNVQGAVCSELDMVSSSISPGDTVSVNQATIVFRAQVSNEAANP
jgi:hypothetical protein